MLSLSRAKLRLPIHWQKIIDHQKLLLHMQYGSLYQRMCHLAEEAVQYRKENLRLATSSKSLPDPTKIRNILCSGPNEEVIREGTCMVDASDFSTLACDRYVNGYSVDTICLKFLNENSHQHSVSTIIQPRVGKTGTPVLQPDGDALFGNSVVQDAKCILTPFHFSSLQHCGLTCFQVASKTVYFDNGLKINAPKDVPVVIKNRLNGFVLLSKQNIFQ